ncbi:MAG: metal-dependent transcriptional regulator [Clostridia bacterium]|nr:metal-dependent transcriptional regulator [Clostridia bacterium]
MIIKESAENYLEAILSLKKARGNVRSIDVATELGVSKPSVSVAMKNFREEGYVVVDENGYLDLTEKGMAIAKAVYERHLVIAKALMALGVSEATAYEDSCRIEHCISQESFDRLKEFLTKSEI